MTCILRTGANGDVNFFGQKKQADDVFGGVKKIAVKKFVLTIQNSVMYYVKHKTTAITNMPRGQAPYSTIKHSNAL